jgi:hypothetical protein
MGLVMGLTRSRLGRLLRSGIPCRFTYNLTNLSKFWYFDDNSENINTAE